MAYFPYATELDSVYSLTNGAVSAVFNSPLDANYAGMLTEVSGLDSPEVRESAEELAQADGGSHGYFWFGRRPITLTARFFGHGSIAERTVRMDRVRRASLAMRTDAILSWTPSLQGGITIPMFTYVRRQGPLRESGQWVKEMQIALVSEYAAIYSLAQRSAGPTAAGVNLLAENQGSWPAMPILRIAGPTSVSNPTITQTAGGSGIIRTTGSLLIASGETLEIDVQNHTATFTTGPRTAGGTGNANSFIDYAQTIWPTMPTGISNFQLNGTTGTLTALWRDTWM
jgi:hypothetical protein